jgi:hypothetical protein
MKIRVSTWSFLFITIPFEYLFLCRKRKFGFNKKICTKLPNFCNTQNLGLTRKQNYLWFMSITNLILAIHTQSINGPTRGMHNTLGKNTEPTMRTLKKT